MKWEMKHLRKSMKPNNGFFENTDKINKPLVKLIRKKNREDKNYQLQ